MIVYIVYELINVNNLIVHKLTIVIIAFTVHYELSRGCFFVIK